MALLTQKILTTPGKYITLQKVAQSYSGSRRPDHETIGGMMRELSASHLGLYLMRLGFVKYQQPEHEHLLKYNVNPQLYKDRYNTPVLPSIGMNATAMQKLDSVAKSMPAKPPGNADRVNRYPD